MSEYNYGAKQKERCMKYRCRDEYELAFTEQLATERKEEGLQLQQLQQQQALQLQQLQQQQEADVRASAQQIANEQKQKELKLQQLQIDMLEAARDSSKPPLPIGKSQNRRKPGAPKFRFQGCRRLLKYETKHSKAAMDEAIKQIHLKPRNKLSEFTSSKSGDIYTCDLQYEDYQNITNSKFWDVDSIHPDCVRI